MGLDSVKVNEQQPAPNGRAAKPVWATVIEDMKCRHEAGVKKYGYPLVANNGRNAPIDAYQEVLDLAAYFRQAILEREKAKEVTDKSLDNLLVGFHTLLAKNKTIPTEDREAFMHILLEESLTIRAFSQFK